MFIPSLCHKPVYILYGITEKRKKETIKVLKIGWLSSGKPFLSMSHKAETVKKKGSVFTYVGVNFLQFITKGK